MNRYVVITVAVVFMAGWSILGCYESVDVTWYEPGVYKGADDPLLDKLRQSEFQRQLAGRFRLIQTDR